MDYDIYIVSDKLTNTTGNLVITIETLNGSMLYFDSLNNYHIADSSSAVAYTVSNETLAGVDITSTFIWAYLVYDDGTGVAQNQHYFVKPLDLKLEHPDITLSFDEHKQTLSLIANKLAKDVYIYVDDVDVKFSDNYFDLLPGVLTTITVLNDFDIADIKEQVKVISLYDSYIH
jgi:beta-mannosidase